MTDPFLSDFLAPGVDADEVPELAALASARPLLDAFITLFRGTEAEVLMRLLVLREIGREADLPRWSPEALRARFTYLDPVKLETVLKRLRDNALLTIGEDGHYALSDVGRNAVAAIAMLLRFGEEEDAELGFLTAQLAGLQAVGSITPEALGHLLSKLNDLSWHFEEAIASGSEFRILDARRRLSANGRWLERGTDLLNTMLADPEVDFDIARIAQRIGLAQSRLARVDAAFQRALNKIESQRVTLGASGISSSDVAAWLRSLDAGTIGGLVLGAFAAVPELPLLAGGHELLDRAEALLEGSSSASDANAGLPPPDFAGTEIALQAEDLRLLEHFTRRLETLPAPQALHHVVAGGGFAPASYRLSLLALLADGAGSGAESGPERDHVSGHEKNGHDGGPVGSFMRLALDVAFGDTLTAVGEDEIAAMTLGEVRPRTRTPEPVPDHCAPTADLALNTAAIAAPRPPVA